MVDYASLLKLAIAAAEKACGEILEVYASGDFQAEAKGDNSPLTIADKRAHEVILEGLKASGLPVLSEEGADIPYAVRRDWPLFWMVDPLDGTKEFLKRNGEFTVNIALIEGGRPVLGVVAVPVSEKVYYAVQGEGAYLKVGETIQRMEPRGHADLRAEGIRVVASRSHISPETEAFIAALRLPTLVSQGSSLKFLLLAAGEADVYPRFAPTMEWDTAAAHCIVNAVGLRVCRYPGTEEELVYNKADLLNPFFLVH